jgi:hypothetical protein
LGLSVHTGIGSAGNAHAKVFVVFAKDLHQATEKFAGNSAMG